MSKFIRTTSLLLVVVFAAAVVGAAQEKRQPKKKNEEPAPTVSAVKLPAEHNPLSWKEYKSDRGNFSILFPGTPREETQKLKDGGYELDVRTLTLEEMALYSVMYLDNPAPGAQKPDAAQKMLDFSVKQAAQMFKAEPLEQQEIELDGHPGRFIRQRLPDGLIMRLKFYVVGRRLYQLMITTPPEQGESDQYRRFYAETASKFLDSFKLSPAAAATQQDDAAEAARLEALAGGAVRGTPAPAPKTLPRAPISGGILNGKAVSKPNPAYPEAALRAGISGTVEVAIVVDEEGRVIAAEAVSGAAELREAAVAAARKARFSPTRLSGEPVKISGRLVYNFRPR